MSNRSHLLLGIMLTTISLGLATDIPFVFDEKSSAASDYTSDQLESISAASTDLNGVPSISTPSDNEIMEFPVTGGGSSPGSTTEKKVAYYKKTFDDRVEPGNPLVRKVALELVAEHPGDHTIEQVSAIYSYLKEKWHYVGDPRGIDYYSYANESLSVGKDKGCAGAGDCDDFAILMSALVESIGGTTRIILAQNNTTGGHAYAEVYVGQLGATNSHVDTVISWLKQKFDTDKIFVNINTSSKDVWLNLDWSAAHPGGPFFKGNKHTLISIRDEYTKTPLLPPEGFEPNKPEAGTVKPAKLEEITPSESIGSQKREEAISPGQGLSNQKNLPSSNMPYSGNGGVDAFIDKGIAQNNAGNYEDAMGSYDQALSLDPSNYLALELKGLALRGMGKYDEALNCFDKAIALDSNRDDAWRDKGDTFYIMGQYQDAVNCFDKAIQIKPCGSYWKQKGEAFMGLGMDKEASDAFVMAQRGVSCMD